MAEKVDQVGMAKALRLGIGKGVEGTGGRPRRAWVWLVAEAEVAAWLEL